MWQVIWNVLYVYGLLPVKTITSAFIEVFVSLFVNTDNIEISYEHQQARPRSDSSLDKNSATRSSSSFDYEQVFVWPNGGSEVTLLLLDGTNEVKIPMKRRGKKYI
jgi:hypothetical protein